MAMTVITAPSFILGIAGLKDTLAFQELGGITSKVDSAEYIYSDAQGGVVHTKQYGKTTPPTIKLKRGLDEKGNLDIMGWHQAAREGLPSAKCDGTLTIRDAGNTMKIMYYLTEAWCSAINVSSIKAGESTPVTIEIEVTCTSIVAMA